ncbi:MAG: hypothetical protein PUJ70_06785, partial [Treponema sp.]|nr:hypothetical protein [Treponema sp.]MDY5838945.1 hypothetical protein [Treponema sp.]
SNNLIYLWPTIPVAPKTPTAILSAIIFSFCLSFRNEFGFFYKTIQEARKGIPNSQFLIPN